MLNKLNKQSDHPIEEDETIIRLVTKAATGDSRALQKLLNHPDFRSKSSAICKKVLSRHLSDRILDPEDLEQELYAKVMDKITYFRPETSFYNESSFYSWLMTIARYIHIDHIRKRRREQQTINNNAEPGKSVDANQLDEVALREAFAKLSFKEREILRMRAGGATLLEIAQDLQISKASVHRILKEIKKLLIEIGSQDKTDLLQLLEESAFIHSPDHARERYTELVDKKFKAGLSLVEQVELDRLEEIIDDLETPLYNETIRRLRAIRDQLSSSPSRQRGGK